MIRWWPRRDRTLLPKHDLRVDLQPAGWWSRCWARYLRLLRGQSTIPPLLFVRIPGGRFRLGSHEGRRIEEPRVEVELSDFYLSVFPVTQSQYALWRPEHKNGFMGAEFADHPAENMDWSAAVGYCEWLNAGFSAGLPSGFRFCLPSECQWEYASRLSKGSSGAVCVETEYSNGDGASSLSAVGWYEGNSGGRTHRVGELVGTDFGLYDMHGNVEEWCRDAWASDAYFRYDWGEKNPEVRAADVGKSESDAHRVIRGGGWGITSRNCRAACRYVGNPDFGYRNRGFRVCACSGPRANQPR